MEDVLGVLKEKSSYCSTRTESVLAWILTLGSCAVLVWAIARSFTRHH